MTYRAAQGCTIGDDTPVLLLDTSHKYLDHKMFIVGLSRVASGKQLSVATRAQQQEVFGWAGQAREDPQWTGIGDMMSQSPVHPERPQSRHESDAESDATESESESEPQERDRRSDSESEDERTASKRWSFPPLRSRSRAPNLRPRQPPRNGAELF